MKISSYFFSPFVVFCNMATLTKHCILQYESYFFIFRVFAFLSEKSFKNRLGNEVCENIENMLDSRPKIAQKLKKEGRKDRQNR